MSQNGCWEVFVDTGDPLCWLLARAAERQRDEDGDSAGDGGADPSG